MDHSTTLTARPCVLGPSVPACSDEARFPGRWTPSAPPCLHPLAISVSTGFYRYARTDKYRHRAQILAEVAAGQTRVADSTADPTAIQNNSQSGRKRPFSGLTDHHIKTLRDSASLMPQRRSTDVTVVGWFSLREGGGFGSDFELARRQRTQVAFPVVPTKYDNRLTMILHRRSSRHLGALNSTSCIRPPGPLIDRNPDQPEERDPRGPPSRRRISSGRPGRCNTISIAQSIDPCDRSA